MQTLREIRERDCYYVDKTAYIGRLLDEGKHYFLSRPRRFGKSLFLDTCKELLEGNEALFEGLAIHRLWDWSVRHPVVRLSFGSGNFKEPDHLELNLMEQLAAAERRADVDTEYRTAPGRLGALLEALHRRAGRPVAVLVDEYDKPILDALEEPDIARANRDFLRGLYATIKDHDAHVRFSFITGVSRSPQPGSARGHPSHEKASKVSLFSGLNNLKDITLDPRFSAICGYTEADLDTVFAPELPGLDRGEIRDWYRYSWRGEEKVYNPFDVLLLFDTREFAAHWFETGTPTFLIETLVERGVSALALDGMVGSANLLSTFDVESIAPEALLFQTGYLTIQAKESRGGRTRYRLGYPNREVFQSLNESLLAYLTRDPQRENHGDRLYDLLMAADVPALKDLFHAFFARIPYEWYTGNDVARFEGYYASVFYAYFVSVLGTGVTVEDSSSRGRADMAVRAGGRVYLFEFKVVEQAGSGTALAQLKAKAYADKYLSLGEPVHLVGVEFSSASRNVVAFDHEIA